MSTTTDFARKMMTDMGWKEGTGLGKDGQGMLTALKPRKKVDNSGLGAHNVQSKWVATSCVYDSILAKLQIAHSDSDKKRKRDSDEEETKEERKARKSAEKLAKAEASEATDKQAVPLRNAMYTKRRESKRVQGYSEAEKAEIFGLAARTDAIVEKVKATNASSVLFGEFANPENVTANRTIAYEGGFTEDTQVDIYNQAMDHSIKGREGLGLGKKLSKAERRDVAQRDARLLNSGTYLYKKFEFAGLLGELILEWQKPPEVEQPTPKNEKAKVAEPETEDDEDEEERRRAKRAKREKKAARRESEAKAEKEEKKRKKHKEDKAERKEKKNRKKQEQE
eukprot:c52408_g1_i1.p1 GENE.c52408_g1_i1~~c52408_g1_i1.p1  ORF type:complete len:338 (+),score=92.12 c52408_g1_i1:83-1096(+)